MQGTMERIKESELIINPDGSIYHLNLKPHQIAKNIILVGDPGRVEKISRRFDKVEHRSHNREMIAHVGYLNQTHIMVMSTGMGTDNIDIVMNELDALVNVDFETRTCKKKLTQLNIIRLGTSGAIQKDIPIDSFAVSTRGIGFDGLLKFYNSSKIINSSMSETFVDQVKWHPDLPYPYFVDCSDNLFKKMTNGLLSGITATAPGFYGPQGRVIRIPLNHPNLMNKMQHVRIDGERIINFEMETSALYGLGKLLGHNTLTMCAIIANRALNTFSKNHHKTIEDLIDLVLERFTG